ncbi:MAG: hypothetical protein R2705_16020 [Ilumatobacteraceae bacterium]
MGRALADLRTPIRGVRQARRRRHGFLLESVEHGEHWSRFSFVGRDPRTLVLATVGSRSTGGGEIGQVPSDGNARYALEGLVGSVRSSDRHPGPPAATGQVMGFLGYDVVGRSSGFRTYRTTTGSCPAR